MQRDISDFHTPIPLITSERALTASNIFYPAETWIIMVHHEKNRQDKQDVSIMFWQNRQTEAERFNAGSFKVSPTWK
jgi:hypothetical protein